METGLTGSLTSQPLRWLRITKGTPRRWGTYFPTAPPLRTAFSTSFTKSSYLAPWPRATPSQTSIALFSILTLDPFPSTGLSPRPLSTTTASSPTGDSPCSWNTDFWFGNFRVNHYNHLENLGVCQNVNYLKLISDGLSLLVPATAPLPFLTTVWLLPLYKQGLLLTRVPRILDRAHKTSSLQISVTEVLILSAL